MSNNFQAALSQKSVTNLRQLLGLSIYRIESPSLEVRGSVVTSFSLSLVVKGNLYLAIDNDRLESPNDFIDYWQLSAEFLETPKFVDVETKADGLKYFKSQVSSIELLEWSESVSPIVEMKIYEQDDWVLNNKRDVVIWDCGILFICENGKRFLIRTSENIPGALDFSRAETSIDFMLKDCNLKLEIF